MKRTLDSAGYTLTEVLIVIGIIGFMIALGPRLITGAVQFAQLQQARMEIQRDARAALAVINRELRQASAASVVIDQVSGLPPHSRITFTRYKPDGTTTTVSYYQQGKKLYVRFGTATAGIPIFSNLTYIAFTYPKTDDATILSVTLTFEKAVSAIQTKALQMAVEKVRLMNS